MEWQASDNGAPMVKSFLVRTPPEKRNMDEIAALLSARPISCLDAHWQIVCMLRGLFQYGRYSARRRRLSFFMDVDRPTYPHLIDGTINCRNV